MSKTYVDAMKDMLGKRAWQPLRSDVDRLKQALQKRAETLQRSSVVYYESGLRQAFDKIYHETLTREIQKLLKRLGKMDELHDLGEGYQELERCEEIKRELIDWLDTEGREEYFELYLDDVWKEMDRDKAEAATEASRIAFEALTKFSHKEIKAFLLSHKGLSQRKIAAELKCSSGTVNLLLKNIAAKGMRVVKHKGGAGAHMGNTYKKNNTLMDIRHHR